MDKLLSPDVGLGVWTALTFLTVVIVLGKFAWGPILKSLDEREERLKNDARTAREAREAAEKLKAEYDAQLARVETRAQELLKDAQDNARRMRDEILKATQVENERLMESARQKMAEEERRLLREVRAEVAGLSLRMAEKILRKGLDKSAQDRLLKEALEEFDGSEGKARA